VAQAIVTNYQGALIKNKRALLALLLLPLAMLAGCATSSVKPTSALPQLPPPPSVTTPQPPTSYSASAASDTQSWQQELMATPLMQGSAEQLGRSRP
jgi:curli biogenesis system outer membrane secretion channel CsgG